ncbi:hypothetical protein [Spongiactinospora sp. TRM90649]|uniref:hypothetical protein n=1 Tax=Spongiactinospora sp. TRM90649 TaxID=3031114 RepID=UPI0023F7937D|nr:hypothetical protein [Spongiactinospora sp. TRM90649]MDF5752812.1 hypothetical protein [Spongiactinospora sp. TRM90649]
MSKITIDDPNDATRPVPRPRHAAPARQQEGRVYREEALREHAAPRPVRRLPLVVSGPSFLVLWLVVAAIVAAGAALTAMAVLAVGAAG